MPARKTKTTNEVPDQKSYRAASKDRWRVEGWRDAASERLGGRNGHHGDSPFISFRAVVSSRQRGSVALFAQSSATGPG